MITKEFLQQFCRTKNTDEMLHFEVFKEPWNYGDYTYASDRSAMIRINRIDDSSITVFEKKDKDWDAPAKFDELVGDLPAYLKDFSTDIKEIGEKISRSKSCYECGGEGYLQEEVECSHCSGTGNCCSCVCGVNHDCGYCDGTGYISKGPKVKCEDCGGTGKEEEFTVQKIQIGDMQKTFKTRYLDLVRSLPDVKFVINKDRLLFEFEGGCGIVMAFSTL